MKKKLIIYTAIFSLIYLLLYSGIAYYNRLHTDDLNLAAEVNNRGYWGAVKEWFLNWESNLNTLAILGAIKCFQHQPWLLNVIIFITNIITLYYCIKIFLSKFFDKENLLLSVTLSCFGMSVLYFSSRAQGDVSYWLTGQLAYAFPLNWLFLACFFWMRNSKRDIWLACICMFLFAHSRFNYDAAIIAVYGTFFIASIFRKNIRTLKFHLPFLFFLLGMISCFLVPGIYKRYNFQHAQGSEEVPLTIAIMAKSYFIAVRHFIIMFLQNKSQLLFAGFCFFSGTVFKEELNNFFSNKKYLIPTVIIAFIGALLAQTTVIEIALKTPIGYGRIFFLTDLLFLVTLLIVFLWLGSIMKFGLLFPFAGATLVIASLSFFVISEGFPNLHHSGQFTTAYDERINLLLQLKREGRKDDVYVTPLPAPGILEINDVEVRDSADKAVPYSAYSIRKYYDLPFNIWMKK